MANWQEVVALFIVFLFVVRAFWMLFRFFFGNALSNWLLKKGRVKWAVKLRFQSFET